MKRRGVDVSKRLAALNSASSLGAKLIHFFVIIWLQQYLLRRISPEEYSLLPIVLSVIAFTPLITTMFTKGLGRFLTEAYAQRDEERLSSIVSTMVPVLVAVAVGLGLLAAVVIANIDALLDLAAERVGEARLMLSILFFGIILSLPLKPMAQGLYIKQKFVWLNAINVLAELFRLLVLCVLLFGVSTRILWVVVASTSMEMGVLLANLLITRRLVPALKFKARLFRKTIAKAQISFGGWSALGAFANLIRHRADLLILARFATAADVNAMYLGSMAYGQIRSTISSVTNPLMPPLIALHVDRSTQRLRQSYLKVSKYAIWTAMLVGCPLIVFSKEFFMLYLGEAYETHAVAAPVMSIALISLAVAYTHQMVWMIASAMGEVARLMRRLFVAQMINLALTLYFVGALELGALGAALASLIVATVSSVVFYLPEGMRLTGLRPGEWLRRTVLPGLAPAGLTCLVLATARGRIGPPQDWLTLALYSAAGALVYFLSILAFGLDDKEKGEAKRLLSRLRLRVRMMNRPAS